MVASTTTDFLGTLRVSSGSASIPSFSFLTDTGLGFYRLSSGVMGVAVAGAEKFRFDTTGLTGVANAKLVLTGDVSAGTINRLITFNMTTQDDRPWISWIDHNGVHKATCGYHYRNVADSAIHNAWEVKTTAADETTMVTRISCPASADAVDIGLNGCSDVVVNRQGYVASTPFGITLKINDVGGTSRTVGQMRAQIDGSSNTKLYVDVPTNNAGSEFVLFRNTSTVSASNPQFQIKKGDGTNTSMFVFNAKTGVLDIFDGTAPGSNVTAGGRLYSESGALKWRDSSGVITVISTYAAEDLAVFNRDGTLTVTTGVKRFRFPFAATLINASAAVNTASSGASIIADVNKNGTTVFTTQGNRPTIAAGANATAADAVPDVTAIAAGDYLTVDVDQIGSGTAGAELSVVIRYRRT